MKLNLKFIVVISLLLLSSCTDQNKKSISHLEENNYTYEIEDKTYLDQYHHVHISNSDFYFDFTFYDSEHWISYEFCRLKDRQCYKDVYGDATLSYYKNDGALQCIYYHSGNREAFNELSDDKCLTFDGQKILDEMNQELKSLRLDKEELKDFAISLTE